MTSVSHAWWRPVAAPVARDGGSERLGGGLGHDFLDRPLFESFAAMARRQPDAVAVKAGTKRIGYGELLDRAVVLAGRIDAATAPEEAVATLLPDPVDAACGILACVAAGRPCMILNPHHPSERLAEILADAGAAGVILAADGAPPGLPAAASVIRINGSAVAAPDPRGAPQDAPCVIMYTSGSTGRPKGIVRSQRQMLVRAASRIEQFRFGPSDRILSLFPLSSGPGISALLATVLSGAALHVADAGAVGARGVLDAARDARITSLNGVPALLRMLLAMDGAAAALATLRSVYTTSETLFRQDIDRWRAVLPPGCGIRTGYGLTEGAPLSDWFVDPDVEGDAARLPIGYPVPWMEFAITDPAGQPVRGDEPGELWARGRLMSLGEWRQGRCEPGRLLADPADPAGAILRTGDLVRLRHDGLLEFLGRIDDQISIRGNRIEPAELERVLRETPGVSDAAIVARRTARDPVLVAFVVADGPAENALRDILMARLRAALPSYMLPARLHVVVALPKLPSGKVDPAALARLDDAAVAG